jgi:hypothetical protein
LDFPGVEVRFVVPQPNGMSTGIPSKGEWTLSGDVQTKQLKGYNSKSSLKFQFRW